ALLDPATATLTPVTAIEYNAHSQRSRLTLGNGTTTDYHFDPLTLRVASLVTTRPPSFPQDRQVVQNLAYFYDPAGNITRIAAPPAPHTVFSCQNHRSEPPCAYTYDPLYRLIQASGREHVGQNANVLSPPQQVENSDAFRIARPQPGDGKAMANYTETYAYDAVGNLLTLLHQVSSGAWTRHYSYNAPSRVATGPTADRLTSTR